MSIFLFLQSLFLCIDKIFLFYFWIIILILIILPIDVHYSDSKIKRHIIKICIYDIPLIISSVFNIWRKTYKKTFTFNIYIVGLSLLSAYSLHNIRKKIDIELREWIYYFLDSKLWEVKLFFKNFLCKYIIKTTFGWWLLLSFIIESIAWWGYGFDIKQQLYLLTYDYYLYYKKIFSVVMRSYYAFIMIISYIWTYKTTLHKQSWSNEFYLTHNNINIKKNIICIYGKNGSGKTTFLKNMGKNLKHKTYSLNQKHFRQFYNITTFNRLDYIFFIYKYYSKIHHIHNWYKFSHGEKMKISLMSLLKQNKTRKIIAIDEGWNHIDRSFQVFFLNNLGHYILLILTFNIHEKDRNKHLFKKYAHKIYNIYL